MASLRRLPKSPNFIACFTGSNGKRYQRSTGMRADGTVTSRRKAQKIADNFEDVARAKKTARQIQSVFQDLYEEVTGDAMPNLTLREFSKKWLESKAVEVSDTTYAFYRGKTNTFLRFLGERADRAAFEISTEDIRKWRDSESNRVSATTVNHSLKFLRVFFGAAKKDGLIADNPATDIPILKVRERTTRRPFTLKEIRSLLAVANSEWRSLIIFALYTGQRLGDLATLDWEQIDLKNGEILLTTRKTSRNQKIPMTAPLVKHAKALRKRGVCAGAVHPIAEEIYRSQGRAGTLSRQFHELMAKAGMVEKKTHAKAKEGQGRDAPRAASKISFHSLRHTTTSLLKNAGVSPAITEEFVGHDSAEMNRVYTHIELESMKKAAALLPDVT